MSTSNLPEKITLPASVTCGAHVVLSDGPDIVRVDARFPAVYDADGTRMKSAEASLALLKAGVPPFQQMTFALTQFLLSDGRHVFVCTEIKENRGVSVTNAWPWLAEKILQLGDGAKPETSVFIEHYFQGSYRSDSQHKETFDLVRIVWDGNRAIGQTWKRIS